MAEKTTTNVLREDAKHETAAFVAKTPTETTQGEDASVMTTCPLCTARTPEIGQQMVPPMRTKTQEQKTVSRLPENFSNHKYRETVKGQR